MAEILLWFFAALGICFLGLEAFRAFGKRSVRVWILPPDGTLLDTDNTAPDVIIKNSPDESLIIDALAQKFDRIYIEDGSDNTHTVL